MGVNPVRRVLLFSLSFVAMFLLATCQRGDGAAGDGDGDDGPVGAIGVPLQCGCNETGNYEAPEKVAPRQDAKPTDLFRLVVSSVAGDPSQTITVHRNSDNAVVFTVQIPNFHVGTSVGLDPSGNRLVYSFANSPTNPSQRRLFVVDLTAATPTPVSTPQPFNVAGAAFDLSFNPNGTYLVMATPSSAAPNLTLTVADLRQGANLFVQAYTDTFGAALPADANLDTAGDAAWGFSKRDDNAFVYAFRRATGQKPISWMLVNLEAVKNAQLPGQGKRQRDLAVGSSWTLSPCGDTLGLVEPGAFDKKAEIFSTSDVQAKGSTTSSASINFRSVPPALPVLSKHQIVANGNPVVTIDNTAANACPQTSFPSAVVPDANPVIGGTTPFEGTLVLNGPAPQGGLVVKLQAESTPPPGSPPGTVVAGVPTSVNVPAGVTSVRFPITTIPVSADVAVTLRASLDTISQAAALTVIPAPPRAVQGVTCNPTSVRGVSSLSCTVALAAGPGQTIVTLQLDNTLAATLSQAAFTVASNVTSVAFTIATHEVLNTTPVTVTAASNSGSSASATFEITPDVSDEDPMVACSGQTLAPNDDGSAPAFALPFLLNFFDAQTEFLFVNNNGNVTFEAPLPTFTPFAITANTRPIIAPFFADVDTRTLPSQVVAYGETTFQGRPAVCVSWDDVGYFAGHSDKLNRFQLLLVDRSTGVSGAPPGDFDIVMNYDGIVWETGDASGGVNGFGGVSAGGGYSPGSGVLGQFFEFPGSRVPGSLLDSNPTTGLTNTRRNSLVLGRHVFEVRNGSAPVGAAISGRVRQNGAQALGDAPVQVCRVSDGRCVFFTLSAADGVYNATALPAGDYVVSAYPPAGAPHLLPATAAVTLGGANLANVDLNLVGPAAVPPGTSIGPNHGAPGGVPVINWNDALTLRTNGCEGGLATYALVLGGATIASGPMTAGLPAGSFSATIAPLFPQHGQATINIAIDCPADKPDESVSFTIYIDPSGTIVTPEGAPVRDATVMLLRSDSPSGPFELVPNGSAIMSPTNRQNPDRSDAGGHYGWDVIAGYYVVRAQKEGCHALDGGAFVESPVLTIPPPVTNLDLVLECPDLDLTPPTISAVPASTANGSGFYDGPVDLSLSAADAQFGVAGVFFELSGAQTGSGFIAGDQVTLGVFAEGDTTVTYWAIDAVGNETPHQTIVIRINTSVPSITCSATPAILWSNDHRLINIKAKVTIGDGATGFKLVSVTSSEPDQGPDYDDRPNDIQGFDLGTPDLAGKLRDERLRQGKGRKYQLVYEAVNAAGNAAQCTTYVSVPFSSSDEPRAPSP
jgi:nidogen-like